MTRDMTRRKKYWKKNVLKFQGQTKKRKKEREKKRKSDIPSFLGYTYR